MKPEPERFRVLLEVPAGDPASPTPLQSLRRWLKALARIGGIRCIRIEPVERGDG